MKEIAPTHQRNYQIYPIGYVRKAGKGNYLEILEPFRPALRQLEHFSHVIMLWWADKCDNEEMRSITQCNPPYAGSILTGVFATRAEYRPNPIGLTICKVLEVDESKGFVEIANVDTFDGTPILDLKAYFPVCDRIENVSIPEWLEDWPMWMPDEGLIPYEEIEQVSAD